MNERQITEREFDRVMRSRHSICVGRSEGGSSYRMGDSLYAMCHDGTGYYYVEHPGFYSHEAGEA